MPRVFAPAAIGPRLASISARLPDKIAITEGSAHASFGELDAAATVIARELMTTGPERTGCVCLLFDSKLAAIKAIFGAARSARAYVPLDAGDPDERLRFIVQDSEPIALLTETTLLERARVLTPAGCAIIDVGCAETTHDARRLPDVSPATPAYLFYTSGSTGQPKGVGQTHENLLFFADAYARTLRIDQTDRVSLLYSLSFSAANMDIFGGLLNGATLVSYNLRREGIARLADWMDHEAITVLHAVPTVFRELFGSLAPSRKFAHLRAIDLGGESVFASDVELFRRHTRDDCLLVNHLAATEASVIAQHVVTHSGEPPSDAILSVGRSPQGLRVRIIRDDDSEADLDEVGEIVVSSAHVSSGYWRRPELDVAAFSADPFETGSRRYRTGDLGRIDAEGNLHFLGRMGARVKIRGHTVDLTEVEAALTACPGVTRAAVVVPRTDGPAQPDRPMAYVALAAGAQRDSLPLRRHLAKRIPAYMLPAAFVFMDALPLTATGKLDRIALSAIEPPKIDPSRNVDPPRDEMERTIADVFGELLKQPAIGRSEDFFLLGGDSLLVVELQTRLRDAFGVGLENFYEDATVASIAAAVRSQRMANVAGARTIPVLLALRATGSAPPLFLVHGRLGQALVSPHFLRLLGDDQPVWAFQARGLDGMHEPHPTIGAMAADYVAEMRKRRPEGPYFLGALCAGALIAIEMARLLNEAGEFVLPLLLLDPPDQRIVMADSRMTEEGVLARLKLRQAAGRIDAPIDDPVYARASVRVATAFEHAIRNHDPRPYAGPVYVLSSRDRTPGADVSYGWRLFAGPVERFEFSVTHSQVLDARDPVFVRCVTHCLDMIREAAKVS